MQEFSSHTRSELLCVFALARFGSSAHCECDEGNHQKRN
jgi:hypothetical protein